jgi:small neutral amino acid transporter SnatA (MarC family)
MNSDKVPFFVNLFGRNGARIFYILMGIMVIIMGVLGLTGIIDWTKVISSRY